MLDSPVLHAPEAIPEAPATLSAGVSTGESAIESGTIGSGTIEAGTVSPAGEDRARELDLIDGELDAVERALARLDDGTYWTCEATGGELPDALLAADPLARRIPPPPAPAPAPSFSPSTSPSASGPAAPERPW